MLNPSVRAVEWGECFMWWPSLMVDFGLLVNFPLELIGWSMQVQCGVKWVGNEVPLECFWFTMWHTCTFIRFIIVEICNIHSPDTSLLYTYIERYALHSTKMFFGAYMYFKSSELRHAVFKSSIKENICSAKEQTNADCRYSGFKNLIFRKMQGARSLINFASAS